MGVREGVHAARRWGFAGAWPYLSVMNLDANLLQGTLPQTWGGNRSLPVISEIVLSRNQLTGSIPPSWGDVLGRPRFPALEALGLLPGLGAAVLQESGKS